MSPSPDIVVALIWRAGALLVGLRPEGKSCPLLWEFPGGKCEAGETHAQALVRECAEELGVAVDVGPEAWRCQHDHDDDDDNDDNGGKRILRLWFYHCTLQDPQAEPEPRCTLVLRWVQPRDLPELAFCPGDLELVEALAMGRIAPVDIHAPVHTTG